MTTHDSLKRYLTFSDGSESGGAAEYGIAYADTRSQVWTWEESLGTAGSAEALAIIERRGWTATPILGGWNGDARDDSYQLGVVP